MSVSELARIVRDSTPLRIIDVRPKVAFESSPRMMEGAGWRNPEEIDVWLNEFDTELPVVVYCVHGQEVSQGSASKMLQAGFQAAYLEGGFRKWAAEGHPVVAKSRKQLKKAFMSIRSWRDLLLWLSLALSAVTGYTAPQGDLAAALSKSKVSLADGARQILSEGEPLSAKFEFDDDGKLSLSIYVAAKGHAIIPFGEGRVLEEMVGNAEAIPWKPVRQVFKDVEHVSIASQQLTLMSLAGTAVLDLIDDAQKNHAGIVFSIAPEIRSRHPVAVVLLVGDEGRVIELTYNLLDGALIEARRL